MLAASLEYERENSMYRTPEERYEAQLMKNPITTQKAVSYFGAMLGLFPPFAMFSKYLFQGHNAEPGIVVLLILVNIVCTVAGYFSGKLLGKSVSNLEQLSWNQMLFAMPFVGVLWGIITGSLGGVFIFIIGAFFGAFIAGVVGGIALPAFAILHRALKKGDVIEEKVFFPIALGITSIITAFILGT